MENLELVHLNVSSDQEKLRRETSGLSLIEPAAFLPDFGDD